MSPEMLYLLCYVSIFVFGIGLIVRAAKIASLPIHLRWELVPVPHEKGKSNYGGSYFEEFEWWTKKREKSLIAEFWYMFQEIFFLKGVWEHNRRLWIFSLPFHQGLYFVIAMMMLFIGAGIVALTGREGLSVQAATVASVLGWIGYSVGALGAAGLFCSRILDSRLRNFTSPASLFNLVFLAALFGTGIYAIATIQDFGKQMTGFWKEALTANFATLPAPWITAHLTVSFLFLVYLPFTYMMHFVAKYFTYHQIRWDDRPMEPGSKMERQVKKLLAQPVTWSAKHINADGKKNWVDIATEERK